jgi:hypothetical protein
MKKFAKFMSLALALIMIVACFAACGGDGDDTTLPPVGPSGSEDESGRDSVKDTVPEDLKFNGKTVTFFVRDDRDIFKNEMDVEKTTDDNLYDAVFYRNATVEQRLGITIDQISQSGAFGDPVNAWNATLSNAVLTKTGDYDTAAIYASQSCALAVEGIYYNVLDLPHLNLNQPWWNESIVEELTLFNTLYFLGGDIAYTEFAETVTLFFNKNLFAELYQTRNIDLYEVVDQGKWTIDLMSELVTDAWIDENSDGIANDGDTVGFYWPYATGRGGGVMDAWIPAMGINLSTMESGEPVLTFYNEHTVEAFEKVSDLHLKNPGTLNSGGAALTSTGFNFGNMLFLRGSLNSGSSLREVTFDYGVLPLPKFDAEQDDYYTAFDQTASLVVVLSTCTETELVGATLELMAAEAYKQVTPVYFERCLKGLYADAPQDAAMYDRILDSIVFDFASTYSTKMLASIGGLFRDLSVDIAQTWDENKVNYQLRLDELIDKLDYISFAPLA